MKTLIATLLAAAAGASVAAPTAALNHDPATYRNMSQKAAAEYKAATAKCDAMNGNDKDVCVAEAKVARVRTENAVLAQYSTTPRSREKARAGLADAEFALARERCDAKEGADKDSCVDNAKSVHTAALADAKADRAGDTAMGASGGGATAAGGAVASNDTRNPANAAAVDKCAQAGADAKTGCLVETKPSPVREGAAAAADTAAAKTRDAAAVAADKTRDAAAVAADKTKEVARVAADKTKEVARTAADKTKEVAAVAAQKTDNALERAGDSTREATATAAQKTDKTLDRAGAKTRVAVADTAITTKVKAGLVKEPDLESLGIHVETEKGVVMLSGFVNSKAEADRAVKVAKGVNGVTTVKSAIQVK